MRKAIRKQPPEFAALLQVHINKLERHALAPIIAHERGSVEISQTELHSQLDVRAGLKVTVYVSDSAGQAGGLYFQVAGFFEIRAHGDHRLVEPHAFVPALAHKFTVLGDFQGWEGH